MSSGTINVDAFGMTANVDVMLNSRLFYLAGGLYSGILHLLIGVMFWYLCLGLWSIYVPCVSFGVLNIAYGLWEMDHSGEGRFKIYAITLVCIIVFWIAYFVSYK
jgi:hypothetical protein